MSDQNFPVEEDDDDMSWLSSFKQSSGDFQLARKTVKALFDAEIFEVQAYVDTLLGLPHKVVVGEFSNSNLDTSPNSVYARIKLVLPQLSQEAIQQYYDYLQASYRPFTEAELPTVPEKPGKDATPAEKNAFSVRMKELKELGIAVNIHNMKAAEMADLAASLLEAKVFADLNVDVSGMVAATVKVPITDLLSIKRFAHGIRKCNSETVDFIQRVTYVTEGNETEFSFWFVDEETATKFAASAQNFSDVYVQFGGSGNQYFLHTETIDRLLAEQAEIPLPETPVTPNVPEDWKSTF